MIQASLYVSFTHTETFYFYRYIKEISDMKNVNDLKKEKCKYRKLYSIYVVTVNKKTVNIIE